MARTSNISPINMISMFYTQMNALATSIMMQIYVTKGKTHCGLFRKKKVQFNQKLSLDATVWILFNMIRAISYLLPLKKFTVVYGI